MSDAEPIQTPPIPPPIPDAAEVSASIPPPIPVHSATSPPPRNTLGKVALALVIAAAVFTPTGICGLPLLVLIPLGLLGGFLGLISLYKAPRWPGLVSILILLVCVVIWVLTTIGIIAVVGKVGQRVKNEINRELDRTQERMNRGDDAPQRPEPTPDHIDMLSAAASALSVAVESQRNPDGSAPTLINLSESAGVPEKHQIDPWGRMYRYRKVDSDRGYTFTSDGPDGLNGTRDDIDLFDLGPSIRNRMNR